MVGVARSQPAGGGGEESGSSMVGLSDSVDSQPMHDCPHNCCIGANTGNGQMECGPGWIDPK